MGIFQRYNLYRAAEIIRKNHLFRTGYEPEPPDSRADALTTLPWYDEWYRRFKTHVSILCFTLWIIACVCPYDTAKIKLQLLPQPGFEPRTSRLAGYRWNHQTLKTRNLKVTQNVIQTNVFYPRKIISTYASTRVWTRAPRYGSTDHDLL